MTPAPHSILVIAGSLRTGSFNRRLADAALMRLRKARIDTLDIDLRQYALPIYDGDLESNEGVPETARQLHRLFRESAGILIVSPEYNAGIPPLLKNAID